MRVRFLTDVLFCKEAYKAGEVKTLPYDHGMTLFEKGFVVRLKAGRKRKQPDKADNNGTVHVG